MNKSQKTKARRGGSITDHPAATPSRLVEVASASADAPKLLPKKITGLDMAFGPSSMADYLPPMTEIPRRGLDDWEAFIDNWFFNGVSKETILKLKPKPGIVTGEALAHVKCIMASFEPKHEHKTAGCAYLMSLWFEGAP